MADFFTAPVAPAAGFLVGQSGPTTADPSAKFPVGDFVVRTELGALQSRIDAVAARVTARGG